jgi:aminoglycoside phosphotransferase (APT) family kinase protein
MSSVDVSAERARSIIRSVFPDAELGSCVPIPGEHRSQLYALTLSDASEMVLKVYAADRSGAASRREAHLLRTITAETGVPVPRLLGGGEHLPWQGAADDELHAWALLSRLPGTALVQAIGLLDDAELEAVAYELGRYLAHLHQIPLELFGGLLEPEPHAHIREKAYLLSQAADWLHECEAEGLLTPDAAARLRGCFEQTVALDRQRPCLTHADLSLRKVIVEPGHMGHHVTGLVGWAHAQGGSPERDIAGLFAWDLRPESAAQKGLLDGYTESAELSPHFWERLDLYELFISLEALLTAHRTRDTRVLRLAVERLSRYPDAARTPPR